MLRHSTYRDLHRDKYGAVREALEIGGRGGQTHERH
jgi:hypothetical protein